MSAKEVIRTFILENFLFSSDSSLLADDDSFVGRELIDSTGILEVITFIEDQFGLEIQESEMILDNLDSINRIAAFLERKGISTK